MRKHQGMAWEITWLTRAFMVLCLLVSHVMSQASEPCAALPVGGSSISAPSGSSGSQISHPRSNTQLVPGPLEMERAELLDLINFAKMQGAGVSTYMSEFNKIEDQVRRNEPTSAIDGAIESLQHNVEDQVLRARALQTQQQVLPNEPQRQSIMPFKLRQHQNQPKGFKLELNSHGQAKAQRDGTFHGGYGNQPRGWQSRSSGERVRHAEIKGQRF